MVTDPRCTKTTRNSHQHAVELEGALSQVFHTPSSKLLMVGEAPQQPSVTSQKFSIQSNNNNQIKNLPRHKLHQKAVQTRRATSSCGRGSLRWLSPAEQPQASQSLRYFWLPPCSEAAAAWRASADNGRAGPHAAARRCERHYEAERRGMTATRTVNLSPPSAASSPPRDANGYCASTHAATRCRSSFRITLCLRGSESCIYVFIFLELTMQLFGSGCSHLVSNGSVLFDTHDFTPAQPIPGYSCIVGNLTSALSARMLH